MSHRAGAGEGERTMATGIVAVVIICILAVAFLWFMLIFEER